MANPIEKDKLLFPPARYKLYALIRSHRFYETTIDVKEKKAMQNKRQTSVQRNANDMKRNALALPT